MGYIDHLSILVMLTTAMLFCRNMVGLGFASFYAFCVLIDWSVLTLFDLQGRHWALIFGGFYALALTYMLVFVTRFMILKLAISASVILLFSSPVLYHIYENYYVIVYAIFKNEFWSIEIPNSLYDIDSEVFWTAYEHIDRNMPIYWLTLVSLMIIGLITGGRNGRNGNRRRILPSFRRKYNNFYSDSAVSFQRSQ